MTRMKAAVLAMTLATGLACKPQDEQADGVRRALPEASSVAIKVPEGGSSARAGNLPEGVSRDDFAVLGATADFYMFTRGISHDLNLGAAMILGLVHAIVQYPVTSIDGDLFIWGPWSETLNPSEYRLTVSQDLAGAYHWSLEGRRKAAGASAAYQVVVAGIAEPTEVEQRGRGTFSIDFDVAEQLDPAGNDGEGALDVSYDLTQAPATVAMDYAHANGSMFHYEYLENPDGSGDFQFSMDADLDENGSALENLEVRSRWVSSGDGRADFRISGGDLPVAEATGVECWDDGFSRIYYADSVNFQATEGDANACAYSDARLPE